MKMLRRLAGWLGQLFFNISLTMFELSEPPHRRDELPTLPDVESTQKVEVPRWN